MKDRSPATAGRRGRVLLASRRRRVRPAGRHGALPVAAAAALLLALLPAPAGAAAGAPGGAGLAGQPGLAQARAAAAAPPAICTTAIRRYRPLAARMSRGIAAALRGRGQTGYAVATADTRTGIRCRVHTSEHFHSASIVKVIILGTLLHDLAVRHRALSHQQVVLATEMITESDNDAATALWDEDGITNLQRFLNLAKMVHTQLGVAHWGLTEVTAADELRLLDLLVTSNKVLDKASRKYALRLMAQVIPSQRWGVPAGAPADVTVHLKNGWLPDPQLWVINSIGVFTSPGRAYRIVVLTKDNPSMVYGVDTVQGVAEVVNRDLNPGRRPAVAPSLPFPSWGRPDEVIGR